MIYEATHVWEQYRLRELCGEKAPLDEKNISTDWIDEECNLFDSRPSTNNKGCWCGYVYGILTHVALDAGAPHVLNIKFFEVAHSGSNPFMWKDKVTQAQRALVFRLRELFCEQENFDVLITHFGSERRVGFYWKK